MKTSFTLICGLSMMLGHTVHAQTFDWVRQAGYQSTEQARAVSSDPAGNAYVTGEMSPGTTFEDTTLYGTFVDGFVAKYAPDGTLLWVRAIVGPDTESPYDISTDADGNSYVTGLFNMTADFGDTSITSAGSFDMFLAKYDTDGNVLWVRRGGSSAGDAGEGVCVDGTGAVHVVGSFNMSATFGSQVLVSAGQMDAFMVTYSPYGDVIGALRGGGAGSDYATDVDARNGIVAITGGFQQTADFGSGTLVSLAHYDAFIACYTLGGTPLWSASGGSDLPFVTEAAAGVAIGYDGQVYMGGSAGGTAMFGPLSFTSNGGGEYRDAFIAAYATDGTIAWVTHGGGNTVDGVNALVATLSGGVAATGHYNGFADFDGQVLAPFSQSADIFTVQYSSGGVLQWIKASGGPYGGDAGMGICLASDGLYVAGLFNRTATFDTITPPLLYLEQNIFLAHLSVPLSTGFVALEIRSSALGIMPNPATSEVTVTFNSPTPANYLLIDMTGRIVARGRMSEARHVLPVDHLDRGAYVLHVEGGGMMCIERVVLQ